jgi:hypothetical protein
VIAGSIDIEEEIRMTAFNIVRMRVKPGHEEQYLEIHRQIDPAKRERMRRAFGELSPEEEEPDVVYATPVQVAAAVKGFSRRYKARRGGDARVDFSEEFDNRINAVEYRRFIIPPCPAAGKILPTRQRRGRVCPTATVGG